LRGVYPTNGPETGNTIIDVSLVSLPVINGVIPKAICTFPGGVEVAAVFVSLALI
jgi:hypothetical protein